jgi:hypothetical protein
MGLDMYAFAVHPDNAKGDFEIVPDDEYIKEEFQYWRKHNALHSWMENLYRAKGGDAETFNCIPLRLTEEDLLKLIEDARAHELQSASGFFWGVPYDYDDEIANQDIEFAHKALDKIEQGFAVYYDSWW